MTLAQVLSVWVAGDPKGEPRHRTRVIVPRYTKPYATTYPDSSADGWRQLVCCAMVGHVPRPPLDGPVTLLAEFYFTRPQRLLKRSSPRHELPYTGKPDFDNLGKLVADQATKMLAWGDDAQVCDALIRKRYVAIGAEPGCRITVYAGVRQDVQAALFAGSAVGA